MSRCCLIFSSSSHCTALSSSNRACVSSRHAAVSSSRHAVLMSSCQPFTVTFSHCLIVPSDCCIPPCRTVVLSSHHPLTPNITRGTRNDGGRCPPPPRTSNIVVGVGLAIVSPLPSSSPWMLFLALQPCRRSNPSCHHRQCPFCCPPPSPTLVAVTITITLFVAITIARATTKLPPTLRSRAAATAADAAATTAPPPSYLTLSCCRAAPTATPPPSCRRPPAVALPPPPLPLLSHCRSFIGWLLRCCPPSDFVIACHHATINALVAGCFRR